MPVRLKPPSEKYDRREMQVALSQIEGELETAYHRGQDIEITKDQRLILTAPDGGRWYLAIENNGNLNPIPI
jgi:hypothetical protein